MDRKETGNWKKTRSTLRFIQSRRIRLIALAQKSHRFSEEDLELLWEAIINMFEHDHSAARGKMAVRKFIVFKHDDMYGNAPSHKLFDLVKITRKDETKPVRSYDDYIVEIDRENLPSGVALIEKV